MPTMTFIEYLKAKRKEKKITQKELAKKAGISPNSLINYETGKRIPTFEILEKLTNALGLDLLDAMREQNEYNKSKVIDEKSLNCKIIQLLKDNDIKYEFISDTNKYFEFNIALMVNTDNNKWIELTQNDIDGLYNNTLEYFNFLLKKLIKQKQGD